MRELSLEQIEKRFDNHQKLHSFEVDELFGVKNLDDEQYRWLEKGYRDVLVFDIETLNFDARMGFLICWYGYKWDILTGETEIVYDHLEPSDMKGSYSERNHDFDKRILETLAEEISKCDILAGHYISKFDIPYYTMRCHLTKQDDLVPEYNDCRIIDTWRITKTKYNMYNSGGNSLRNAGKVIAGYDDKTSVDLDIWKSIYYVKNRDWKKNLKYICDHCEIDVCQNYDLLRKEMLRINAGGMSIWFPKQRKTNLLKYRTSNL